MTTEAPLSLARSEGRGSKASGSAAGGMMVSTCARSPTTARARPARSPVVATTRMFCAATVCATNGKPRMDRRTSTMRSPHRACALRSGVPLSPLRNEDALWEQAVHVLLAIRDRTDPTIHRDAGKPIGIEARDLLFAFEPLDHAHRGRIHGLIQVRVLRVRNVVFRGFLGRTLHILARRRVLGTKAVNALLDVDHLRHTTIRYRGHQSCRLIGGNIALLGEIFDGLRLCLIPSLVEILIKAHGDPGRFGLDAREIERLALDHLEREIHLPICGLYRREVDLTVTLGGM